MNLLSSGQAQLYCRFFLNYHTSKCFMIGNPNDFYQHRQPEVADMTRWDLTNIPNHLSEQMWRDMARNGNPNFVRRSRQWWTDMANVAIQIREQHYDRVGYDDDTDLPF
ncbi:hypothetical protein MBANPS3_009433 [Mucor bainieri]